MAGLKLKIKVENLDRVRDALGKLSGKQAKQAYANAINDTAAKMQKAMRDDFRKSFESPTNYIANSPWVERATPEKLSASIGPRNPKGNGIDPQKILQAQEFGGTRADKRMEVALRSMGLLPPGMQVALPAARYGGPYPGTDDGRGNFNGNFVRKLLAYFKANLAEIMGMKKGAQNKALKKYQFTQNIKTKRVIKLMDGKEWFVSSGGDGKLGPGIWVRDGKVIGCVVAFVRTPSYRTPRISMERLAKTEGLQDYLDKRVRFRVRNLAEGKSS